MIVLMLLSFSKNDADKALDWLVNRNNKPMDNENSFGYEPTAGQISQITQMGFSEEDARSALAATGGDVDAAIDTLLSG